MGRALDAFIGVQMVRRIVRDFELRAVHRRRPSFYMETLATALLMPMLKDVAPLDDRLTAVEKRLQAIPGFLEEARANLAPTLPPVAIESAVEFAGALQDLVTDTVKRFACEAGREGDARRGLGRGGALTGRVPRPSQRRSSADGRRRRGRGT